MCRGDFGYWIGYCIVVDYVVCVDDKVGVVVMLLEVCLESVLVLFVVSEWCLVCGLVENGQE